jgi:hypothetical protein
MVYFVQARNDLIKIGMTEDLTRRLQELRNEHGRIVLLAVIPYEPYESDGTLHVQFKNCWISGEWFAPDPELLEFIAALPKTAECVVARHRTPNSTINDPTGSKGRFPRPPEPIDDERYAKYVDALRADTSDTSIEARIANSASGDEIQGWLYAYAKRGQDTCHVGC